MTTGSASSKQKVGGGLCHWLQMTGEWNPVALATWLISRVSTVGPKADMLVCANFIKLAAITPALKTFKIILAQNSLSDSSECLK